MKRNQWIVLCAALLAASAWAQKKGNLEIDAPWAAKCTVEEQRPFCKPDNHRLTTTSPIKNQPSFSVLRR